jgi:uncharacterized protein YjbI with pentapeptide repeats
MNMTGIEIQNVKLNRTMMTNTSLSGANAVNFQMTGCECAHMHADNMEVSQTGLKKYLSYVPLIGSTINRLIPGGSSISGNRFENATFNNTDLHDTPFRRNATSGTSFEGLEADCFGWARARANLPIFLRWPLNVATLSGSNSPMTGRAWLFGSYGAGQFAGTSFTPGAFNSHHSADLINAAAGALTKPYKPTRTPQESMDLLTGSGLHDWQPVSPIDPQAGREIWIGANGANSGDPHDPRNMGRWVADANGQPKRQVLAVSYLGDGRSSQAHVIPVMYDDRTRQWVEDQSSSIGRDESGNRATLGLAAAEQLAFGFNRGDFDTHDQQMAAERQRQAQQQAAAAANGGTP